MNPRQERILRAADAFNHAEHNGTRATKARRKLAADAWEAQREADRKLDELVEVVLGVTAPPQEEGT